MGDRHAGESVDAMGWEVFWALLLFVVVTLITPGPNNTMLMTTGLNFGFRRGLPHLMGVALGFGAMVLAVGLGLGAVFAAYPAAYSVLKYVGAAYLLYLAWQIATAGELEEGETRGRPISFLEAAAFQWLNPKGWVMALGAASAYAAVAPFPFNMALIAFLFGSLGILSSATWLGFGTGLKRILTSPGAVRAVNITMALLLVASLWPILADAWR
jgi:threonine/homoserine/homoserine lactone efflux protein